MKILERFREEKFYENFTQFFEKIIRVFREN